MQVLIVDDEPAATQGLEIILKRDPTLTVSTCNSGFAAIEQLKSNEFDLVLLDIDMPIVSGFDVISQVGQENMPFTIFVTAYEEYALKAFGVRAFDYVLKPVKKQLLLDSIDRLRNRIQADKTFRQLHRPKTPQESKGSIGERISFKSNGSTVIENLSRIIWIESSGNYVRYCTEEGNHLCRATMGNTELKLNSTRFLRIHRSTIVNKDRIKKVTRKSSDEFVVKMDNGKELISSKRYVKSLMCFLESL